MSLPEIDGQIQDLHAFIRAQEATIRALKGQHNDLVPISRLPNELLELIFHIVCESSQRRYHQVFYPRWVRISFVCHRWRTVALGYPRLWSRIDDLPYRWLFEFIERSAPGPIDASINVDLHGMYPMKRLATKGLPRMRRLVIKGRYGAINKILPLLNAPAPLIEAFSIDNSDHDPDLPRLQIQSGIFARQAPLLREIRLGSQVVLNPLSPLISDKLEIFESSGSMFVSDIRKILQRAPNLLNLEHVSHRSESPSPNTSDEPIVLAHLASLTVDVMGAEEGISLLANLSLPALESLSFRVLFYDFHSTAQDADIALLGALMQAKPPRSFRLVPAFSRGVHVFGWATVGRGTTRDIQRAAVAERASATLSFLARGDEIVSDFFMLRLYRSLCAGLPLADVRTLTLEIDHVFSTGEWTGMLAPLVRVSALKLIGRKMFPAVLVAATPAPSRTSDALLFPALESVVITHPSLRATLGSPSLDPLLGTRALPELAEARRRMGKPIRVAFEDCARYSETLARAMVDVAETRWDNAGIWDDERDGEGWLRDLFGLEGA